MTTAMLLVTALTEVAMAINIHSTVHSGAAVHNHSALAQTCAVACSNLCALEEQGELTDDPLRVQECDACECGEHAPKVPFKFIDKRDDAKSGDTNGDGDKEVEGGEVSPPSWLTRGDEILPEWPNDLATIKGRIKNLNDDGSID